MVPICTLLRSHVSHVFPGLVFAVGGFKTDGFTGEMSGEFFAYGMPFQTKLLVESKSLLKIHRLTIRVGSVVLTFFRIGFDNLNRGLFFAK